MQLLLRNMVVVLQVQFQIPIGKLQTVKTLEFIGMKLHWDLRGIQNDQCYNWTVFLMELRCIRN
jgi:hypothetical protein